MNRLALLCVYLLVALASATPAMAKTEEAAGPRGVGLLPLDPVRLPGDALLLLQADLQASLETRDDVAPLSQPEMLTHLKAVRAFGLSCDRESVECIIRIGALSGTERLVRGVATRGAVANTGYEVMLQLWLHDTVDGRELSYVYAALPSEAEPRGAAIDDVWARLFAPMAHGGALHIVSAEADAEIIVDTLPIPASAGEAQLHGLAPGVHIVEVKKPGHEPLRSSPTLGAGDEAEIYALLPPVENEPIVPVLPPRPPSRLTGVAYSMVFTGSVLFVSGGVALLYGMLENLHRNAVTSELRHYEALYRAGDYDVTDANDAARIVSLQGEVSDNLVPFWATVGGGIIVVLGAVMTSGGVTLLSMESE